MGAARQVDGGNEAAGTRQVERGAHMPGVGSGSAARLLALQRAAGNRAVSRAITGAGPGAGGSGGAANGADVQRTCSGGSCACDECSVQRQPKPAAPTVTFGPVRAANTPEKTPDRIPPKVDTPVSVSFGGTTGVTISVKPIGKASADPAFGPGEALVNGKPSEELASPGTIQVRGTKQSFHIMVGLRLVAEQGGKEVGASAPFAVSALPVGMDMKKRLDKGRGEPARGMVVAYNVRSDSGDQADLDRLKVKEVLQSVEQEGCFKAISPTTLQDQAPDYGLGVNEERTDTHTVRADILSGPGLWTISQTHMWKDTRTGAEGVMPHSGYVIRWSIGPFEGGAPGLYFILTKYGMDTSAQGVASDFGFGTAFTIQEK